MNVDDMILLSIDDHTIEPPDMFAKNMPAKFRDQAPRLVKDADNKDQWLFQNESIGVPGLAAVASWPKDGVGLPAHRLLRDAAGLLRHRRPRWRTWTPTGCWPG